MTPSPHFPNIGSCRVARGHNRNSTIQTEEEGMKKNIKESELRASAIEGPIITRRSLLAGLAGTSALALGGSLAGCAPKEPAPDTLATTGAKESTAVGELNPQDDSFTVATTDFSAIFQPIEIGSHTVRNRIVKSGAGSATMDTGVITDQTVAFYRAIAEGGAGLVIVEGCDYLIQDENTLKPIVDAIHEAGALAGIQFAGTQTSSMKAGWSPIDLCFSALWGYTKAMSVDDIHEYQRYVIDMAKVCQASGFDLLDLNAGCNHMYDSFLSRFWNVERDDEYGPQSLENRARLLTELIAGIKKECPGLAVQVLYNGVEENFEELGNSELCIKPEEAVAFGKMFEEAGADALQIRVGTFGNHAAQFIPDVLHIGCHGNTGLGTQLDFDTHLGGVTDGAHEGVGMLVGIASLVKEAVNIPVSTVGNMDPRLAPDMMNGAIADGKIDFLVMNRPLLADPELPNKLMQGRLADVLPCNHCVCCLMPPIDYERIGYCRVNPAHIRACTDEMPEGYAPTPAEAPKKIMVIGGGAAGMEAAIVAAQRGHSVSLYEKTGSLGGSMNFASLVKGPHERIADYIAYQQRMLEQLDVRVVTGTEVDESTVAQEAPDVVVVAVGGDDAIPKSGTPNGSSILMLGDAMAADLTGKVCIVGGSLRATDFAHYLLEKGCKVELVHEGLEEELASAQAPWPRAVMLSWLKSRSVVINNQASNIAVSEGRVTYDASYGVPRTIECDTVVLCEDLMPNSTLADSLSANYQVVSVGDCVAPSCIQEAVTQANLAARSL